MRKKKKYLWLLVVSLLFLISLSYLILNFSPAFKFSLLNFQFSILIPGLALLFLFVFSLFSFILNARRGILLGLLVVSYLLLRMNGLTSPFFAILLLLLFGGIELFFVKRK